MKWIIVSEHTHADALTRVISYSSLSVDHAIVHSHKCSCTLLDASAWEGAFNIHKIQNASAPCQQTGPYIWMLVQWTGRLNFLIGSARLQQICPKVCLGMATAAKSHKRARKGDACMVQKQDAFQQKLQVCQELLGRSSSGCRFCGHCCFTLFRGKEDVILNGGNSIN